MPVNHARIQFTDCDKQDRYQKWAYRDVNNHIYLKEWPQKCMDYTDNLIQEGYILVWDCVDFNDWWRPGDETANQVYMYMYVYIYI